MRFLHTTLVEGYKEAKVEFTAKSSLDEVNSYIERFKELVKTNKAKGDERNIDYWRKQGWDKFKEFVNKTSQVMSNREVKRRSKNEGNAINVVETDKWLIVVPLDKASSCFYGKNTDWCTTKPFKGYFEDYFFNSGTVLFYALNKESGEKWATAVVKDGSSESFNQRDEKISADEFKKVTGFLPSELKSKLSSNDLQRIDQARNDYRDSYEELEELISDQEEGPEIERLLLKIHNEEMFTDYTSYASSFSDAFKTALKKGEYNDALINIDIAERNWQDMFNTLMKTPRLINDYYPKIKDYLPSSFYEAIAELPQEEFNKAFTAVVKFPEHVYTPELVKKVQVAQLVHPDIAVSNLPAKYINPDLAYEFLQNGFSKMDKLLQSLIINKRQDLVADLVKSPPVEYDQREFANIIYRMADKSHSPHEILTGRLFAAILNAGETGILARRTTKPEYIEVWSKSKINPKVVGEVFKNVPSMISDQAVKNLESAGYGQYIPVQYRNTVTEELARIKKLSGLM